MITELDEAIEHCKEVAEKLRDDAKSVFHDEDDCLACADEHEQIAEWLEELKERREAERPSGDLISREALKEHKFLTPQFKLVGGRRCGKTKERIIEAYQKGWNDCIDAIIDNAPTIEPEITEKQAITKIINSGWLVNHDKELRDRWERPQGDCKSCRHRDPEDKKCDCGAQERQGCPFPVSDDYFCKFYEKGGAES